ncbi:Gfo/Idh/MocA family protein [Oxynema aestuarii]|uniref:Gfo/Idh/MocA family oxidoreductase n=1 Tax=Oxynema aestuarii AP17 TaxID=2064643 RepID=A0A6H1U1P3_9CYAN|nr:Gfo/Idh/MocA family oxidoreductase [Oxynema aestuarii]QIZ72366.1 Gfo/Idh/MocA family oxidoreductase [Oxynema aestuarii AP17]
MTDLSKVNSGTIGVAIVGTGFGQKVHIPAFQAHPRTEVVAVYHRDIDKATAIAQKHGIAKACDTIADVVNLPEVQAVSISTPPFLHYEMAKPVLSAAKHLLLEKPTTLNASEAKELYQIAQNNGSITAMDFEFRYVPAWQRFKQLIDEGYCGTPRLIKIDWLVASRANSERPWNWYAQKEKGGGALGAIGSHCFDYIDWLFGPIRRLSGLLTVGIPERPDPSAGGQLKPVDADDTCVITLELADGSPCQVNLSSATYAGRGHWVEVYGSSGTLVLGSGNLKDYVHGFELWGAPAGESLQKIEIPQNLTFSKTYDDGRIAPLVRLIDRWVQSIDAGQGFTPSLREGIYSQLLMDLTHQSNDRRTWVDVPKLDDFLS